MASSRSNRRRASSAPSAAGCASSRCAASSSAAATTTSRWRPAASRSSRAWSPPSTTRASTPRAQSTGSPELDLLLGGGLVPGTNTLLLGPSGVGKTTTARALHAGRPGARRDARPTTCSTRGSPTLLDPLRHARHGPGARTSRRGRLTIMQIDPAELSPGEFACRRPRRPSKAAARRFVAIDSLNAYLHAMPGEEFLILQMHELLSYLNQQGVTTLLVLGPARRRRRRAQRRRPELPQRRHPAVPLLRGQGRGPRRRSRW